jgi:hypothetical protein
VESLQAFVWLPIGALVYLPFLRLAARWLALERLSFGTAFLLGLMLGGAGLIASSVAEPFVPDDALLMAAVLAVPLLAISSAICGYYVVTPQGGSVGMRKGFYLAALSLAMLGGVLAVAAFLMLLLGYRF